MRTLAEMKTEQVELIARLKELEEERKEFQANCNHPTSFVKRQTIREEDEYGSYTDEYRVKYECQLCEGAWGASYVHPGELHGHINFPTLEEVISELKSK